MNKKNINIMIMLSVLFTACGGDTTEKDSSLSFGDDISFLQKWDDQLVVLSAADDNAQLAVSPKYQGKVFTSTAEGQKGKSFGWINYGTFEEDIDPHMNAYGGEDRLWLGPEGGSFSLFFEPGKQMVFDNWHTPPQFDTEEWELVSSSDKEARLSKKMTLLNYAGTQLKINIDRQVELLENSDIESMLAVSLNDKIKSVGFKTTNTLHNAGDVAWDKTTGAPCMWSLNMFTPTPETVILIPYHEEGKGKVATTDYFGEIDADRIKMEDGMLYFKADGLSRGKLGIPPHRVKPIAGSYAPDEGVLTITLFDVDSTATYLNQEWTTEKDPFQGDAMNAYNDGPLEDGTQMGPFYEVESVSPAAFIQPAEHMVHRHSVFHFVGDKADLDVIAQQVLGVSLDRAASIFVKK